MNQEEKKQLAAKAAFDIVFPSLHEDSVIGIGTGSTTNLFIEELNKSKSHIKGVVCSSESSKDNFKNSGIDVLELNDVHGIDIYIDGADEFNKRLELIKGGGGALTREKVLANSSKKFICIVDDSKYVDLLGQFPLAIEVLEIARSAVAREMMRMGGRPVYRKGFRTDSGHQIIDVSNLKIEIPFEMEAAINNIPGVIENGIFAKRKADIILKATENGVEEIINY